MAVRTLATMLEATARLRGARRKTVDLPHGRMSYFEAGKRRKGVTVVLVHGLGTSNLSWVRVIPGLARRHHVIAPDLPGFGASPTVGGRPFSSVAEHAEALAAFLRSDVVPGPCLLVGQSMGGWVSVKGARLAPERIDQLVLVNSAGIRYEGIEELRTLVTPKTRDEVFAFWKRAYHRTPWYYRLFWKEAAANMRMSTVVKLLETLSEDDFINGDLPKLEVPVTIVWGRADRLIPAHNVDALVDGLRSTRVIWLARCGHVPAVERPREFVAALEAIAASPADSRPRPPALARRRLVKGA